MGTEEIHPPPPSSEPYCLNSYIKCLTSADIDTANITIRISEKTFFHVKRSVWFRRMAKTQTTQPSSNAFNVSTTDCRSSAVNLYTSINKVICYSCWQSPNQTNTILTASDHMPFSFYLVDHNLFTWKYLSTHQVTTFVQVIMVATLPSLLLKLSWANLNGKTNKQDTVVLSSVFQVVLSNKRHVSPTQRISVNIQINKSGKHPSWGWKEHRESLHQTHHGMAKPIRRQRARKQSVNQSNKWPRHRPP